LRLLYPGANADVAVDPLTPTAAELAAGEVDPPQTQDAYWLTNYGQPGTGSADTTFLISHRWIGGDAPFNRIGNLAKPGDRFMLSTQIGVLNFTVSTVQTFDKATLNTAPIWNAVPGRVVMITCDLHDPWGKNTVITADPTPPSP
jgi:sortase (surface protein transpeptidase)